MTTLAACDAVLFDLDGVLTPTADVHMRAWRETFVPLFASLGVAGYEDADYFAHLDGKPRYEGVAALLASRGLQRPLGAADDPSDADTIGGIGNRKNRVFERLLTTEDVAPYPGSAALVDALRAAGTPVAVVSSSKNAVAVLRAAGLTDRFGVVIDGLVAADRALAGKPAPDTFLAGAAALGADPAATVVLEDAVSGVRAAASGGFGLVVGVDRGVGAARLLDAGADRVVADLAELVPEVTDA